MPTVGTGRGKLMDVQYNRVGVPTSGSPVTEDIVDQRFSKYTGATTHYDGTLDVAVEFDEAVTFASNDESIATVDSDGAITRVDDGTVTIQIITSYAIRGVEHDTTEEVATTYEFVEYVETYLSRDAADGIDDRLSGPKELYTSTDHATPSYTRSGTVWCNALDLTGVPVWRSGLTRYPFMPISTRHVIGTRHVSPSVGQTIRYVTSSNTVVERTITGVQEVTVDGHAIDVVVALLDSALPGTIKVYKLLPDSWTTYMTDLTYHLPVIVVDQTQKALVSDWHAQAEGTFGSYDDPYQVPMIILAKPNDATRLSYCESIVGGDSSSPVFLIVNDEPILLTALTYGGAGIGMDYAGLKTEIQTAMNSLLTGHTITEVDLSGFPTV